MSADIRYGVVDLAVAKTLRKQVMGADRSVAVPLLAWTLPDAVQQVGPWLVKLSDNIALDMALSQLDLSMPWGYYLISRTEIGDLRTGLRRFALAEVPTSKRPVLFRYWDPRVMGPFLRIASPDQRRMIFDRIDRIVAPDDRFNEVAPLPTG